MLRSINVADLSAEQREVVEKYLSVSSQSGVLVSVYAGQSPWDLRPLLLEDGLLSIIRILPLDDADASLSRYLVELYDRVSLSSSVTGLMGRGRVSEFFWFRRKFFRSVLDEKLVDPVGFQPRELLQQIFQQVCDLHYASIFHGNICPSNIGFRGDEPVLLDFGMRVAGEALGGVPQQLDEKRLTVLDLLGLANLFSTLLKDGLTTAEQSFLEALEGSESGKLSLESVASAFSLRRIRGSSPAVNSPGTSRHILSVVPSGHKSGRLIPSSVGMVSSQSGRVSSSDSVVQVVDSIPVSGREEPNQSGDFSVGKRAVEPRIDAEALARIRREHHAVESSGPPIPVSSKGRRRPKINGAPKARSSASSTTEVPQGKPVTKQSGEFPKPLLGIVFALVLFLVLKQIGIFEHATSGDQSDAATYAAYWSSDRKAFMSRVATAAAGGEVDALNTIVEDVLSGSNPPHVSSGLIRVAFNPLWANELRRFDRRMIMHLALADLLENALPPGEIERAHPAVLFAISASLSVDQSANWLSQVNIKKLFPLASPIGESFRLLSLIGVEVLGDPSARALSHILVGDQSREILQRYLHKNDALPNAIGKLKILLHLGTKQGDLPERLWPYLSAEETELGPLVRWFAEGNFTDWESVSRESKLGIVAAESSFTSLSFDQLADLVQYPIQSIRERASEQLELLDASLVGAARVLGESFGLVSRAQSISLLSALHLTSDARFTFVSQWFETTPDPNVVVRILAARASLEPLDPFSIEAVRYLKEKKWDASHDILAQLVQHPEVLARALVYAKLDPAIPSQRKLLEMRAESEPNEKIRGELTKKLRDLPVSRSSLDP